MLNNVLEHVSRRWMPFIAVVVIGCFPGCAGDSNTATVSGTVTVDGEMPEVGSIAFFSVDQQSPTAGAEIVNGEYQAEVWLTDLKVEIRVPKVVGTRKLYETADSPVQEVMEEVLPSKYHEETKLRFTPQPGRNEKNWILTTK